MKFLVKKKIFSRKQKIILMCLITLLVILCFASITSIVVGWRNGDPSVSRGKHSPKIWKDWRRDRRCYGTHDWIAEAALDKILKDPILSLEWYDTEGLPFWTDTRIRIFLFGTAAPDEKDVRYMDRHGVPHYGLSKSGKGHLIYFNPDGTIDTQTAADYADKAANKATEALKDGDCGLVAFYLGQMTHYIGDMSQPMHVVNTKVSVKNGHNNFEKAVMSKTNGLDDITGQWSWAAMEKWFAIYDTAISWVLPFRTPAQLAIEVARKTRYASEYGDYFGANIMIDVLEDYGLHSVNSQYWEDDDDEIRKWPYEIKVFMETLNFTMNNAIDACGSAIQYVRCGVGSFTCKNCAHPWELVKKLSHKITTGNIFPMAWLMAISQLGGWAAVVAGPMVGLEKELAAKIIS